MKSARQLLEVAGKLGQLIKKQGQIAWDKLAEDIDLVQLPNLGQQQEKVQMLEYKKDKQQQKFEGLDQLDLLQSRAVENNQSSKTQSQQHIQKIKRIKDIEKEKKLIITEMKKLDSEIDEIKGKNQPENHYKKREKIQRDQSAAKNAQKLVKDLKIQRKEIQNNKRRQREKLLKELQLQQEQRRKVREQQTLRLKEQKRQAIIERMEQDRKRKQQRRLIQQQSNHLIVKLKKQEKLQKEASLVPSQIIEVQNKKRALQKKNNNFDLQQIEEHDRKYCQIKLKARKQKQERSESMKVHKNAYFQKFEKNVWIERLEEEERQRKQEQKVNDQRRKKQLEKRLKYGELVKNIFIPKKREQSKDARTPQQSFKTQKGNSTQNNHKEIVKPHTPQDVPSLPKIKSTSKRNTQNSKMYREESLPGIKNSKNLHKNSVKQFDPDQAEKERVRKIRQHQLRKQTNERLKKLEGQNHNKGPLEQKIKYQNYLGKVKLKKQNGSDWKKIIDSTKMSDQEKYSELMKKAGDLEAKAKIREDRNPHKDADEDAVNLYIGSIQAKLALLEKF